MHLIIWILDGLLKDMTWDKHGRKHWSSKDLSAARTKTIQPHKNKSDKTEAIYKGKQFAKNIKTLAILQRYYSV